MKAPLALNQDAIARPARAAHGPDRRKPKNQPAAWMPQPIVRAGKRGAKRGKMRRFRPIRPPALAGTRLDRNPGRP